MINTNPTLKADYECYQGIIKSLKDNDFEKFTKIINNTQNNISSKMKRAIQLYKDNIKYIENTFKYEINNGILKAQTT